MVIIFTVWDLLVLVRDISSAALHMKMDCIVGTHTRASSFALSHGKCQFGAQNVQLKLSNFEAQKIRRSLERKLPLVEQSSLDGKNFFYHLLLCCSSERESLNRSKFLTQLQNHRKKNECYR